MRVFQSGGAHQPACGEVVVLSGPDDRFDQPVGPPPLSVTEATRIFARLREVLLDRGVVLVGGQALELWAAQLEDRLPRSLTQEIASRDIDLLGERAIVQRAAELLDARVTLSRGWQDRMNPLVGVATFLDSEDQERRIDFLDRVHGLHADDIRETAIPVDITASDGALRLWVMHPHRCLESRVRNAELASKQTALAYRQIEASILCARAFATLLLDEAGEDGVVAVPKLSERIFTLAHTATGLGLFRDRGIDVTEAVIADERLPTMFLMRRLPQLRQRLNRARGVTTPPTTDEMPN